MHSGFKITYTEKRRRQDYLYFMRHSDLFKPITKKRVLEDIQQSKDDFSSGRYEDARTAMEDMANTIRYGKPGMTNPPVGLAHMIFEECKNSL